MSQANPKYHGRTFAIGGGRIIKVSEKTSAADLKLLSVSYPDIIAPSQVASLPATVPAAETVDIQVEDPKPTSKPVANNAKS